jgi:hypothetical protein
MVTPGCDKDLGFMLQSPESLRVDNPVTVALKDCAYWVRFFVKFPAEGIFTPDSMRRETFFPLLNILTYS